MANYKENFASKLDWAMPFQRTGAFPLDRSNLFESLADAQLYAQGGADKRGLGGTSYIGQMIVVYENDVVTAYIINADRSLKAMASTASDGSSVQSVLDALNAHKAAYDAKVKELEDADKDLADRLDTIEGEADVEGSIKKALADAKAYADTQDITLHETISTEIDDDVKVVSDALSGEITRAKAAEKANADAIEAEKTARENADTALGDRIAKFETDGEKDVSKIKADLEAEVTRAKAAEESNANAIEAEKTRAEAAEQTLTNNLVKEVERATNVENGLSGKIDIINGEANVEGSIKHAVAGEATARTNADNALQGEIDTIKSNIGETGTLGAQVKANKEAIAAINDKDNGILAKANKYTNDKLADAIGVAPSESVTGSGLLKNIADAEKNAKDYADSTVANLVGSAPETLDTLKELADALGNDANFATTVANQIGTKADKTYVDTELGKKVDKVEGSRLVTTAEAAKWDAKAEVSDVTQALTDAKGYTDSEITKITTGEGSIGARLTAVEEKNIEQDTTITNAQKQADKGVTDAAAEAARAKAAELELQNSIDAINNADTGILAEAKKYADQKDSGLHTTITGEITSAVETETNRAIGIEAGLRTDVDKKVNKSDYDTEVTNLKQADKDNLEAAKADATAKDNTLKTELQGYTDSAVEAEANRAKGVEAKLREDVDKKVEQSDYNTKVAALEKADADNKEYVDGLVGNYNTAGENEESNASGLRGDIESRVAAEKTERVAADNKLQKAIDEINTALGSGGTAGSVSDRLNNLESVVGNEEGGLVKDVTENTTNISNNTAAIEIINGNENQAGSIAKALKDAKAYTDTQDNALHATITDEITDAVEAETNRATAEEGKLKTAIDSKVDQSAYNTKVAALEKADTDNLAAAKKYADDQDIALHTIISSEIDTDVAAEAKLRSDADTALGNRITNGLANKADKEHGNHVPETQAIVSNKVFLRNDNTWAEVTPANIGAAATNHGTHVEYATEHPKAPGTAAAGTSKKVAREDHVHPSQTTITGNAGTATKLATARTITVKGDATGSVSFDGSADKDLNLTLSNSGVATGSYGPTGDVAPNYEETFIVPQVTVDIKGRVTSATNRIITLPTQTVYENVTSSKAGLMSAEDKAKLDKIEDEANKYVHPENHSALMIVQDETHRFVSDDEKADWNAKVSFNGTASTDKHVAVFDGATGKIIKDSGFTIGKSVPDDAVFTDTTYEDATTLKSGLMSSSDKSKLDGIEANANNYTHPETHDASMIIESTDKRFVSDTEKANWNAKETTDGAQSKADTAAANALQSAKKYADDKITDLVNGAPEAMDTLKELADAIDAHQDVYDSYVQTVSTELAKKVNKVEGSRLVSESEITKWNAKAEVSQVNQALNDAKDYTDGEIAKITTGDGSIGARLAAVETKNTQQDTAINTNATNIANNKSVLDKLDGEVTTEGSVKKQIKDAIDGITTGNGSIGARLTAVEAKNKEQDTAISNNATNLTAEINRAKAAEEANATNIADNKSILDKLDGSVTTEGSVKKQIKDAIDGITTGDGSIGTRLIAVETKNTAQDEAITNAQNQADKGVADAAAEVTRATAAEKVLTDNLAAEVSRAKAAEKTNSDAITVNSNAITTNSNAITVLNGDSTVEGSVDKKIADNNIFDTDILTVNELGGIKAGENLNGMTIEEVLKKLLYPYVAHLVSASSSPNGGVFEYGNNQTVTAITANITKKSEPITKVEFVDGSNVLETKTDGIAAGGSVIHNCSITVSTNKSFTVRVTDKSGKVVTANTSGFNFVYPYYWGVCANDAVIDEAMVKGLTKKVETKGTKNVTYTADFQRAVIAYPASYGNITKILDPNSFDVTATFTKHSVNVTGLDGQSVSYNVYVNGAFTATNFKFTFSY